MLPFPAADTEFTDKVANFHPYCPVTLNEKWAFTTAGVLEKPAAIASPITLLVGVALLAHGCTLKLQC